ncbi:hypothetical protein A2974_01680 [Candidatus Peregrinibacteria bacterium RIFCSPLOWO2_01_FULL_48_20]|nr:MAG: hypothetical protein A2974_01680 [Candidatus Peregrinibacteria bacterium RIFCSPLOWO2_01_FULL_48_20]
MYIKRQLELKLKERLFKGKILVVYGPRQAGKTTLIKQVVKDFGEAVRYVDCELLANNELLARRNTAELFSLVQGYKIVVFDEAQTVKGIGSVLKSLFDHHPEVQYIATGSSSFDLANEISEPLTGRSIEYTLYPLGMTELAFTSFDAENKVSELLRFGAYPGIQSETEEEKIIQLNLLVSQYLYKNVLAIEGFRKPELVISLLKLLAFQIGNEVSYRELSTTLGTSVTTVQKYIDLLEKNFVIIRIGAYSNNRRNEVVKSKKIYFVDLGLRNALIDNFAPIHITARQDIGVLFENCMFVERLKHIMHNGGVGLQQFFWRTISQKEIDYIECYKGLSSGFEFKWNPQKKLKVPELFTNMYPNIGVQTISPRQSFEFISR